MRTSLALLLSLSLVACDGGGGDDESSASEESTSTESSDEGWTGADDSDLMLGNIDVTVDYAGEAMASLTVGAFPECPPVNPPVSFKRIDEPVFPLDVQLVDLEPGTWCVYGFIDLPPENPTFPGEEDPQGSGEDVVVNGDTPSTSLTLIDP